MNSTNENLILYIVTLKKNKKCRFSRLVHFWLRPPTGESHVGFIIDNGGVMEFIHMCWGGISREYLTAEVNARIIDEVQMPQPYLTCTRIDAYRDINLRMTWWDMLRFMVGLPSNTCASFVLNCLGLPVDFAVRPDQVIDIASNMCYNTGMTLQLGR